MKSIKDPKIAAAKVTGAERPVAAPVVVDVAMELVVDNVETV